MYLTAPVVLSLIIGAAPVAKPPAAEIHQRLLFSSAWVRTTTQGVGTGWVVDVEKKWLVTNLHVVGDQDRVEAFFVAQRDGRPISERSYYLENQKLLHEQGRAVRGKVILRREASDLALVELEKLPEGIKALPLAKAPAGPGDVVHSVGQRQDSEALWNHCTGEVRQVGQLTDGYFWRGKKLAKDVPCLITQSPILPGDSGGAIVNENGEVVGVLSGLRPAPLTAIAIQASEVRDLLAQAAKAEKALENAKSSGTEIYRKLPSATVWVRPTATEGRAAGWVVDKKRKLVLTTSSGAGSFDLVDVLFPRIENNQIVAEVNAYADRIGLRKQGLLQQGLVLFRDPKRDLALIELHSLPDSVNELPLAKEEVKPAQRIHALSHPSGVELLWLYSSGIVRQSAKLEVVAPVMGESLKPQVLLLQIPHQSHSSGGPVVNDKGQVVGLLAAKEGAQQQLGYALAATELGLFMEAVRPVLMPKTAADFHALAKALMLKVGADRAYQALEKANQLDPMDPAIVQDLQRAALDSNGSERQLAQVTIAKKLLGSKPDSLEYQACLALALAASASRDNATKLCDQILTKDPKIGDAYLARALCRDDKKNAIADLDEAIRLAPDKCMAYRFRAAFHWQLEDDDKAIADLSRAIELSPYSALNISRAELYVKKRDFKKAIADFERALEIFPESAAVYANLSRAWRALGDEAKAIPPLVAARRWNLPDRFVLDDILAHGSELTKRWPDDHHKRAAWFEQSLGAVREFMEDKRCRVKIADLLRSKKKECDAKMWADHLEKQVGDLSNSLIFDKK